MHSKLQEAKEFVWECDRIGFRYFIAADGLLSFKEGPDWDDFKDLRSRRYPGYETLRIALSGLCRIEAPSEPEEDACLVYSLDFENGGYHLSAIIGVDENFELPPETPLVLEGSFKHNH